MAPTAQRARLSDTTHAEERNGTRSVERSLRLLKELSSRGEFGWRLSDLAQQVGLDRGTCHRMLACFVKEGFAERHADDLRYYPGQLLFEMGLAVPRYAQLREHVEPLLARFAAATGCVATFILRSGNDAVCAFQQRGGAEVPGMLLRVGTRRPLITTVGGLAILQRLPAAERVRIVEENTRREFTRGGARRIENLDRMRHLSERYGFGFTIGDLAPGLAAIGTSIGHAGNTPVAALTLTGSQETLNASNVAGYHSLLLGMAEEIRGAAGRLLD